MAGAWSWADPYLHPVQLSRRYIPFRIELVGKTWSGDWSIDGKDISIRSAYGWRRVPLGRRKPEVLAKELLLEILREWCGADCE